MMMMMMDDQDLVTYFEKDFVNAMGMEHTTHTHSFLDLMGAHYHGVDHLQEINLNRMIVGL